MLRVKGEVGGRENGWIEVALIVKEWGIVAAAVVVFVFGVVLVLVAVPFAVFVFVVVFGIGVRIGYYPK